MSGDRSTGFSVGRMLSVAALALIVLGASASSAAANHSWGGYHWARTTNPFTVKLGDNLTTPWKTYLNTASGDWTKSDVLDTAIVPGQVTKRCRATAGQDQICNGTYGSNGWLGLASVWVSSSHITQGTVKLNDSYFNTATYNNPNEKLHVMCQEVGHTFGLDHQSTDGSSLNTCMDYFSNTGANAGSALSTSPNQHDYDELVTIYTHTDSSTTVAASTTTAGARGLRRVRDDLYVEDHGNGNKRFVFVSWTNRGVRHSAPAEE